MAPAVAARGTMHTVPVLLLLAGAVILAGVVAVATAGRALGGVAFLAAALGAPGLSGLYPLAAADLAFAIAHASFWRGWGSLRP